MIISCEVHSGLRRFPVLSRWSHIPDNPLVVEVEFLGHEAVWTWSLDMIREAVRGAMGRVWGSGDVRMKIDDRGLAVYLDVPDGKANLFFPLGEVEEFLSQIDDSNAEMILGQKLDEFLESL